MRRGNSDGRRIWCWIVAIAALPGLLSVAAADIDEGVPSAIAKRLEAFVAAFNSGDPEAMLAFYRTNMTREFQDRRPDDETRARYKKISGMIGALERPELEMTSEDEVTLTATTSEHGDFAELVFEIEATPPHRIRGYSVSLQQAPPPDDLPGLDVPPDTGPSAFASMLDAYLNEMTEHDQFSGSVLVAKEDRTLFERAYGLANRESGTPNRTDTLFDLGSITKTFTKVAAGQLLRDGKLALDDTVLDRIPDYPNRETGRKITVEHLLNHTSGLGDIFSERFRETRDTLLTPRDFIRLFAGEPLSFEPGEGTQYSNAGYVLLGAIVEAASGQPYEKYIEENIFEPARMDRSGFFKRDGSVRNVAVGYTRHGWDHEQGDLRSASGMLPVNGCPAGSSSSSAGDLLKFDRALRSGRLLGPAWTPWFYTDQVPEAGASAEKGDRVPDRHGVGFAGGAPGVNAMLESEDGWVIIVLANMDPPVAQQLARKIRRAVRSLAV